MIGLIHLKPSLSCWNETCCLNRHPGTGWRFFITVFPSYCSAYLLKHSGLRRKGPQQVEETSLSRQLAVSHEWSKLMVYFNTSTNQRCLQKHDFNTGTSNNAFVNACLHALSYELRRIALRYMQRKQYENRSELKFHVYKVPHITWHYSTLHYITATLTTHCITFLPLPLP